MSGGGTQTQQTQQTSDPWGPAQPAFKLGLQDAQNLYEAGIGSQPYTGSTVIPYSNQSMQAFDNIEQIAGQSMGQGNPFQTAFNQMGNIANNGFNEYQTQALGNWQNLASGGAMQNNPYFEDVLSNTLSDVSNYTNQAASGAGRYGSGMHTGVLADSLGDVSSQARFDEYARQLGRMDNATQSLFTGGQQGINNQMAATSMLPDAFNAQLAPANAMAGVGAAYEDLATRQMNDQLRIWQEIQNAPWQQIAKLQAVASGTGNYGTQTGVTQATQPNNVFGNIAGTALGLASMIPTGGATAPAGLGILGSIL